MTWCSSGSRAAGGTPALSRSSEAARCSVTRKFAAMQAPAWYAARSASASGNGSTPSRAARLRAAASASSLSAVRAAETPSSCSAPRVRVNVCSGCSAKRRVCGASSDRGVAPLVCASHGPGAIRPATAPISRSGTHSTTRSAVPISSWRPVTDTGNPRSRRRAVIAVPTRPAPTTQAVSIMGFDGSSSGIGYRAWRQHSRFRARRWAALYRPFTRSVSPRNTVHALFTHAAVHVHRLRGAHRLCRSRCAARVGGRVGEAPARSRTVTQRPDPARARRLP